MTLITFALAIGLSFITGVRANQRPSEFSSLVEAKCPARKPESGSKEKT